MREKTAGNTSAFVEVRDMFVQIYQQNVCNIFSCSNRKVCLLIEKWSNFFTKDCPEYVVPVGGGVYSGFLFCIFWAGGLKFLILGFFWVAKFGQYFFWVA